MINLIGGAGGAFGKLLILVANIRYHFAATVTR